MVKGKDLTLLVTLLVVVRTLIFHPQWS